LKDCRMVKILFVITKKDVGGAQKYVRDLAENLDPKRFQVKILTGGTSGIRFLSNAIMPHVLFINDFIALAELFFFFRREKPDVVHLNSSKAGIIGALAARLYRLSLKLYPIPHTLYPKVIFTAHGWVFNPDNKLNFLERQFYILLHKLAGCFQDKIINVSEYDRQLAIKHRLASLDKLVTIYNGVDATAFLNKKDARRAIRTIGGSTRLTAGGSSATIEADNEGIWVGSIGRLVFEKDYSNLVEAAFLIPEAKFFIFGSGPEHNKLKTKITKLNLAERFYILENISPASLYLKAFDIFALSSIKEGLPYTMLEAMAAQLPIVVTRVGGMTEIIEGRGLVMPPREPEELARAIRYFIEHSSEARGLAKKARQFVKTNLALEKMIAETSKIYLA